MQSMAISKFKATCLAVLERVRKTGEPVVVTKRGVPVAQVVPPPPPAVKTSPAGSMAEITVKVGNLVDPLPDEDWEALN